VPVWRGMLTMMLVLALATPPDSIAATVNGAAITVAEIDAAIARTVRGTVLTAAQAQSLRRIELDDRIDHLLLVQHLDHKAIRVDTAEIDSHMKAMAQSQAKQGRSLAAYLKSIGMTESQFRNQLTAMLRVKMLIDSETTREQYREYFEKHRAYFSGATVTAAEIFLPVSAMASDGEWAAATARLAVMKSMIEAGTVSFAELAKKSSLGPTAKSGGRIGTLNRRDPRADEATLAVAFATVEKATSAPVRAADGVRLIHVTAKHDGANVNFDAVLEAVRDEYAADAQVRLVKQLRSQAEIRILLR
jgi:parvulin-like peptidyl-prolyl isomerase